MPRSTRRFAGSRSSAASLSGRKKAVFVALYVLFLVLMVEGLFRAYLCAKHGATFLQPSRMARKAYAELAKVLDAPPPGTGDVAVLVLAGSVLDARYASIVPDMERMLRERGVSGLVVHNLACPAHSSRDNLFKYKALEGRRYDAVVVYETINEVRANNCPARIFRPDYGHYGWYELFNVYDRHRRWINISVIPYALDYSFHRVKQALCPGKYVPNYDRDVPREWIAEGADIKTDVPYAANLNAIADIASNRQEALVLMTYAYYVPTNYSLAAFTNRTLDYVNYALPIEVWGEPSNVVKGIEAHNRKVREIVGRRPEVFYIDMEALIPKEGRYFNDICHLSPTGCVVFAEALADEIVGILEKRRPELRIQGGPAPSSGAPARATPAP
jgi:hypothetical protein